MLKHIDGVSVGLKGFNDEFYRRYCSAEIKPILESLRIIKESGVAFEITNVIIPTLNDDFQQIEDMCIWIKENLGEETQLHFYRYSPTYRLAQLPPTPISTLEHARKIAENVGLKYVYVSYLDYPSPNFEDKIYCSKCHKLVLYRKGNSPLLINNTINGKCKFCGEKINRLVK